MVDLEKLADFILAVFTSFVERNVSPSASVSEQTNTLDKCSKSTYCVPCVHRNHPVLVALSLHNGGLD